MRLPANFCDYLRETATFGASRPGGFGAIRLTVPGFPIAYRYRMGKSCDNVSKLRTLVIVPAHNEAGSIRTAIKDLQTHVPWADVVVVDDGSTDGTARIARRCGAEVLTLPCNLGVGGAVQTGYMYAHQNDYDAAIQFDGDAQHRANQIPKLLELLSEGTTDLVVGSRLLGKRRFRFGPLRFIGSRLLSLLVSAIVRKRITDPTSGFRGATKRTIAFFAKHYPQTFLADTAESLVWAARSGLEIREVSIRMRRRRAGASSTGAIMGLGHTMRIILALLVDCLEGPIDEPEREE